VSSTIDHYFSLPTWNSILGAGSVLVHLEATLSTTVMTFINMTAFSLKELVADPAHRISWFPQWSHGTTAILQILR
jgi:hypothetical protein